MIFEMKRKGPESREEKKELEREVKRHRELQGQAERASYRRLSQGLSRDIEEGWEEYQVMRTGPEKRAAERDLREMEAERDSLLEKGRETERIETGATLLPSRSSNSSILGGLEMEGGGTLTELPRDDAPWWIRRETLKKKLAAERKRQLEEAKAVKDPILKALCEQQRQTMELLRAEGLKRGMSQMKRTLQTFMEGDMRLRLNIWLLKMEEEETVREYKERERQIEEVK